MHIKNTLLFVVCLCFSLSVCSADKTGLLSDGSWLQKVRKDHPRLIFTAEDLPLLRERAAGVNREEYRRIKRYVDALPKEAKKVLRENLVTVHGDGSYTRRKPSTYGHRLYLRDGSEQAVRAALVYLITGEKEYAQLAYRYLELAIEVLEETAANGVWADWMGNFRINLIMAYDWIYNELSDEQRRSIMLPLLDYIVKAQPDGEFKFRRTSGGYHAGNYGEIALQYFAGLAAHGDGIDDKRAQTLLRNGAEHFVKMMDYRDEVSDGSGLLSTITAGYSFYPYPFATFFFLHTWQSAMGEDISARWTQMMDFPKWFDYSAIRFVGERKFLTYGIGDAAHTDNAQSTQGVYLHMAQVIHFYSKAFPQKVKTAYAVLQRLPYGSRDMGNVYPFFAFRLDGFDAAQVDSVDASSADFGAYFYNPTFGLLLMRSGRSEDDTFAAFRFGSKKHTHQHYDELSFIIYKRGFLALDGGSRSQMPHHHMYAGQTVAHNSILIHEKEEPIAPYWREWGVQAETETYYNHGGQNSLLDGKAVALQSTEDFIYAVGDATASYASSKSKEVVRQFVYIKPDIFVIFDRVVSVRSSQKKEILFHSQNKPEELAQGVWRTQNEGVLFINTLLPQNPKIHLEGGKGREFWASGRNWELDGGEDWDKRYQTTGKWRLEVSDAGKPAKKTEFLHVLKAALPQEAANVEIQTELEARTATVTFSDEEGTTWQLRFNRSGEIGLHLKQILADGTVRFDAELPNEIESVQAGAELEAGTASKADTAATASKAGTADNFGTTSTAGGQRADKTGGQGAGEAQTQVAAGTGNAGKDNAGNSVLRDYGAVAPLASVVWGSAVATNNEAGQRVVVAPLWTGWNDAGERSSAFMRVNVDDGSVLMSEEVWGATAFSAFLSEENKFYFSQNGQLVAFDVETGTVAPLGQIPPQMPLRFTSDDAGRIYFSSYPNAELLRYDPQSGQLENFGPMAEEKWPQYPFIAVDADGWVYMVVRHKQANLIGFNPQTLERKTYLEADERKYVDAVDIARSQDGAVYVKLDSDNQWRKFRNGQMERVNGRQSPVAMHRTATREPNLFADGSRMGSFKVAEKYLTLREADGSARRVEFDYTAHGARIYSLFALDGVVYGTTALPYSTFALNTADGSLELATVAGVPHMNALAALGGKLYGVAYPTGSLYVYDPKAPLQEGFKRIYTASNGRTTFGRPYDMLAHPDGIHLVMVGNPARALAGGGMLVYNTVTDTPQILEAAELVPEQGTKAIIALPEGDLLGGTSTNAPTGGLSTAKEAVLYRLNWKERKVAQVWSPIANATEISDLLLTKDGKVLGLTNAGVLFRFDADSGQLLGQKDLSAYGKLAGSPGLQTTNSMVNGPDGMAYILFGSGVLRVDPQSLDHQQIYSAQRLLSGGLTLEGNTLYFAGGERLLSLNIADADSAARATVNAAANSTTNATTAAL